VVVDRLADRRVILAAGALADQETLGLDAEHDRDDHEQHADREGADGIPDRIAGEDRQADAGEGEDEAEQRGDVLEQHDRELGGLRVPDELHPALLAPSVIGLLHCGAQRERLEHDRDREHQDRQPGHLERVRVLQLVDALIDREHAADGEQDDGHHERVHVTLAPVAERVLLIGDLLRAPTADEQQQLVACVGDRVHALGEHRGRAGEEEGDELGHRDTGVREQCCDDRLAPAGCTHAPNPRMIP
jgi:hypothetical protein